MCHALRSRVRVRVRVRVRARARVRVWVSRANRESPTRGAAKVYVLT